MNKSAEKFKMHPRGVEKLREAIVQTACQDIIYDRGPNGLHAGEAKAFFRSEWGRFIVGSDNPEKILAVLSERRKYRIWKKATGCSRCKIKKCIHNSGEHFTVKEDGQYICLKEVRQNE